jgi:hypothetical protein
MEDMEEATMAVVVRVQVGQDLGRGRALVGAGGTSQRSGDDG